MVVRLTSKWDMRRLAKSIGATVLPRLSAPTPDEMGFCEAVKGEGSPFSWQLLKYSNFQRIIFCSLETKLFILSIICLEDK